MTLYTADLSKDTFEPTLVASLHAPLSGLKAVKTESGINFVGNCLAYEHNGSAYNPELVTAPKTSGQLYDANFVRHWNYYITAERVSVFSGVLSNLNGTYSYDGKLTNLLSGMNYTITRPESPVQASSSDPGDYDLSPNGKLVAFRTKSPDLPKANYTASYIYVVPFDGSEVAVPVNGPGTTAPETAQGASGAPVWSHDSSKLAYTQQDGIDYESDKYKLYVAEIDGTNSKVRSVAEDWDSSPTGLKWSHDDVDLWVTSELHASIRLWLVPQDAPADYKPTNFTGPDTSIAGFGILADETAFVSASASWTSRMFYKQHPGQDKEVLFTANEVDPELEGLKPDSVSNFWITNEDGDDVQTFMFYPTDFDPSKKYPLAFIIHGGPQSTQGDTWRYVHYAQTIFSAPVLTNEKYALEPEDVGRSRLHCDHHTIHRIAILQPGLYRQGKKLQPSAQNNANPPSRSRQTGVAALTETSFKSLSTFATTSTTLTRTALSLPVPLSVAT